MMDYQETIEQAEGLQAAYHAAVLQVNIVKRYDFALIRCLPIDEVIRRVHNLHNDDQQSALLYRLLEVSFTDEQVQQLSAAISALCNAGDSVAYKQKQPIDRAISRLLRVLPEEDAWKVAETQLLSHPRKARRLIAYLLMKRVEIDQPRAQRAWENYLRFGDIEALHILARSPVLPDDVKVSEVLIKLDEEYWRTRFIASLLTSNRTHAYELAYTYPLEFVWAVGRVADKEALPILQRMLDDHKGDLTFMGYYIWTLGRIGTHDDLESLREWVEMQSSAAMESLNFIR